MQCYNSSPEASGNFKISCMGIIKYLKVTWCILKFPEASGDEFITLHNLNPAEMLHFLNFMASPTKLNSTYEPQTDICCTSM